MTHPPSTHGRSLSACALACLLGIGPTIAVAWDEEPTDSSSFENPDTGGDGGTLSDTYQDTHRMEPPEGAEIVPEGEAAPATETEPEPEMDTDPQPEMDPAADDMQFDQPADTDELDDTWEDTHTIGGEESGQETGTGTTTEPAEQIEQQMEQQQEEAAPPDATPDATGDPAMDPTTTQAEAGPPPRGSAWMHRYDQIGLYGAERSDDDAGLEGIFLYGYDGPNDGARGSAGLVTVLAADLPVATKGDSVGEGYLGFGLQGGGGRMSLFGTIGGVYARTVRASDESESDTAFGAEAGVHIGLGERSMLTAAIREDPNELIDENRARLGVHIGAAYIGVRHSLDSELSRLDLAVRF